MTATDFLKYRPDRERLLSAAFFPPGPLGVNPGDHVGVVLLGSGGPRHDGDLEEFLYRFYMDPVAVRIPLRGWPRHVFSKAAAARRSRQLRREYDAIGGHSPVHRLAREQASALDAALEARAEGRLRFSTDVSMRYAEPQPEEIRRRLEAKGVNRLVLLPLFPQYSAATTGTSLAHWSAHARRYGWSLPVTAVREYAVESKFVEGLAERLQQGLQRFPREIRRDVEIVFVASGPGLIDRQVDCDPYCCLVHKTAQQVLQSLGGDRAGHVAFYGRTPGEVRLAPRLRDTLERLAAEGHTAVLLVSVGYVTDHLDTAYRLEVSMRQEAEQIGLTHYEVAPPLNCHPLLIEGWGDAVLRRLSMNGSSLMQPLVPTALICPRIAAETRRCRACEFRAA